MTADLDRMRASLAALKMRVSRAVPTDRVRMENTAAIIAQAIEAITTSRQALKRMRSGVSVEMIFHNAAAAFQSCPEVTQRLIVQAEEQLARNRAADAQAAAWLARFEAALDLDEAEALPRQALTPWNAHN
jgi:ATP-dependent DNA ligase